MNTTDCTPNALDGIAVCVVHPGPLEVPVQPAQPMPDVVNPGPLEVPVLTEGVEPVLVHPGPLEVPLLTEPGEGVLVHESVEVVGGDLAELAYTGSGVDVGWLVGVLLVVAGLSLLTVGRRHA